jgi:hypothetical protein
MQLRAPSGWRHWLLPSVTLIGIALALAFALLPKRHDLLPPDCSLSPTAYRPGTFRGWKVTMTRGGGEGGGELFALVDLDDGRRVVAHNVANPDLKPDDRVTVAEIACVNRAVHLLTDFPAAPPADARP